MADPLKRKVGQGLLTSHDVCVVDGAGIYVLVGAAAVQAGVWAPLPFSLTDLIAAPTVLSLSKFSNRLRVAAGDAAFDGVGLNSRALVLVAGLAVVAARTVPAGAAQLGRVGYPASEVPIDPLCTILEPGGLLTDIAVHGALERLSIPAIFAVVEFCGPALVVWAGMTVALSADWRALRPLDWSGVGLLAVLVFFAFIGFEDIVNLGEEVERPDCTLPRAILISLVVPEGSTHSISPLALVRSAPRGGSADFLSGIAVFAALNGVLVQPSAGFVLEAGARAAAVQGQL